MQACFYPFPIFSKIIVHYQRCIGGVGAFLIQTGYFFKKQSQLIESNDSFSLTVSMRISDDEFTATWETFRLMFLDTHTLSLWLIPLALAVLLRLITHKFHHQLIFPLCKFLDFLFSNLGLLMI